MGVLPSFKKSALALVLIALLLNVACATKADKAEIAVEQDNTSVQAIKNRFVLGIQTKAIDELISLLSDDFKHKHFGGKDQIRMILTEAERMGYLDNVRVNLTNTQDNIGADGHAMISPIQVEGVFGCINFSLYFKDYDGKWLINEFVVDV